MKPLRSLALGSLLGASLCLVGLAPAAEQPKAKPAEAQAQPKTARAATAHAARPISAEDQKAIIALFKGVDPSKYRLQFNNGKTVAGSRRVAPGELEQVRTVTNPGEAAGAVVLAVKDEGVMYVFAVTKNDELTNVLGAEKTAKLNAIMAKYSHAGR